MTKTTILFYSSPNYSGHAKELYDFINKKYSNTKVLLFLYYILILKYNRFS